MKALSNDVKNIAFTPQAKRSQPHHGITLFVYDIYSTPVYANSSMAV